MENLKAGSSFINSVGRLVVIKSTTKTLATIECKDWKKNYKISLKTILLYLEKGIYLPVNFTNELSYEIY